MLLWDQIGPILGIILVGFFCGKKQWFNPKQVEGFEFFLFKIALPCFLFTKTYQLNVAEFIYWPYVSCFMLSFIILALLVALFFWKKHTTPNVLIRILSASYINSAFYAIPVLTLVLNNPEAAIISNILQIVVINSLFMILIGSLFGKREKPILKRIITTILTPIILLPILGMLLSSLAIKLPSVLTIIINNIGECTMSLALIVFGLSMSHIHFKLKDLTPELSFLIIAKSFLHPLVTYFVGINLDLTGYWLNAAILIASAPTALLVHFVSKQFEVDHAVVKSTIALTSITSLISLMIIVLLIRSI